MLCVCGRMGSSVDTDIKFNAHDNHCTGNKQEALRGKVTFPRSPDSKCQAHDVHLGDLTPKSVLLVTMLYSQRDNLTAYKTVHVRNFLTELYLC